MRNINKVIFAIYFMLELVVIFPTNAYSGAADAIMNTQDYNQSSHYLVPIRVRDASGGDNLQNGLPSTAVYGFDGLSWDRIRGDSTFGLDVDVTRMPTNLDITGSSTPADAYANPTDAINSWSFIAIWNGTGWDRARGDITNGLDVDVTRVPIIINSNTSNTALNITADASNLVKASSGTVNKVITNIVGDASKVAFYNDSTVPCDTGYLFTVDTTAIGVADINHEFTSGICALTSSAVSANISILYR